VLTNPHALLTPGRRSTQPDQASHRGTPSISSNQEAKSFMSYMRYWAIASKRGMDCGGILLKCNESGVRPQINSWVLG
jgi:hypothetical protein